MNTGDTKPGIQRNRLHLFSVAATTIASILISIYFLLSGTFIVFQNLFYVPIVLSCVYYTTRGFAYSVGIVLMYVAMILIFSSDTLVIFQGLVRAAMFIAIAGIVTFLSIRRNRAMEELHESEERYRGIVNNVIEGIYQTTPAGRYRTINPAFARMFGYDSPEEMISSVTNIGEQLYVNPEDRLRLIELMSTGSEKVTGFEVELLRKDRTRFWVSINAVMVKDAENNALFIDGTCTDITERKRAEEALRESEERFRTLSEAAFEAIAIHEEGILISGNDQYFRMFGYEPDEMLGKQALPVTIAPEAIEFAKKQIAAGGTGHYESVGIKKDGAKFPIEIRARHMVYKERHVRFAAIVDITERKRAEELLQESEASVRNRLKAILEPQGDFGDLELSDIVDVPAVQSLMENFHRVTGIGSAIVDDKGKVLVAVGWQDICTRFHRCHPETLRNCVESDTILARSAVRGTFTVYRCKNGMWDMASPIVVAGHHVGNVYLGQFLYADETPDVERFRVQARRYGFNEEEYIAALGRIPRYSREGAQEVMAFYSRLADMISSLSFSTVSLARTITERGILEDQMRFLGSVVEQVTESVIITNARFEITYINQAAQELYGFSLEEIEGQTPGFFNAEPLAQEIQNELYAMVSSGKTYLGSAFNRKKDGSIFICEFKVSPLYDKHGAISHYIGLQRDITERKQAEEELNSNYALLQIAGETAHFGGWSVDLAGSKCTWSDAVADIHEAPRGYAPQVEGGIGFYAPEWREKITQVFSACAKGGIPYDEDMEIITQKGKRVWVRTTGKAVRNKDGKIIKVQGAFQDITSLKLAEEQIRASLHEKEILLKEIHHRVKNNLQVVSSILNLQSEGVKDGKAKELLEDCRRRIRAMSLIHDRLYRSKDLARIGFREYLEDLLADISHAYGARGDDVTFSRDVAETSLDIDTAIPLGLMVNELVSNAFKHAFPGDRKGTVAVTLRKQGDSVFLTVKDDGIGFPENLDFRQTESLGMQLVVSLTEQLEGTIELVRDGGAEFRITLPWE